MFFRPVAVALVVAAFLSVGWISGAFAASDESRVHFPEPWINKTTGDLSKDLAKAQAEGKILAVFWEQEGCIFCVKMHEINFQIPEIVDYITKNFYTIQLDMRGSAGIADFDGRRMSETKLGQIFQVRGTPTTIFYTPQGGEVARMPGYAEPVIFKKVFEFVVQQGYKRQSMIDWIRGRLEKEAEG